MLSYIDIVAQIPSNSHQETKSTKAQEKLDLVQSSRTHSNVKMEHLLLFLAIASSVLYSYELKIFTSQKLLLKFASKHNSYTATVPGAWRFIHVIA